MYAYLTKLFVALVFVLHGTAPATTHVIVDNNRIVNGSDATNKDTGFVVYLIIEKQQNRTRCGGSIINEQTILTAAQCLKDVPASDVKVYAGTKKFSWHPDSPSISVEAVHSHPDFDPESFDNDIALVRLAGPLTFNNNIRAIDLVEAGDPVLPGITVVGTDFGWGQTETGHVSSVLQYVRTVVAPPHFCKDELQTTDRMMCGIGYGSGDSGGPLVEYDLVIGIMSYSGPYSGPFENVHLSVYANVSALRPWVDQTLAKHYHEKLPLVV